MTKYTKDYMIEKLFIQTEEMTKVVQANTDVFVPFKQIMENNVKALNDNNAYHQVSNETLKLAAKKIAGDGNLIRFLIGSLVTLLFITFITFSYLLGGKELLPFLPKLPL